MFKRIQDVLEVAQALLFSLLQKGTSPAASILQWLNRACSAHLQLKVALLLYSKSSGFAVARPISQVFFSLRFQDYQMTQQWEQRNYKILTKDTAYVLSVHKPAITNLKKKKNKKALFRLDESFLGSPILG